MAVELKDKILIPAIGSKWLHRNGNVYTVKEWSNDEGEFDRQDRYPVTIAYVGDNGKKWSRFLKDWHRSMTSADPEPIGSHTAYYYNTTNGETELHGFYKLDKAVTFITLSCEITPTGIAFSEQATKRDNEDSPSLAELAHRSMKESPTDG